jgi:hypothetical protein
MKVLLTMLFGALTLAPLLCMVGWSEFNAGISRCGVGRGTFYIQSKRSNQTEPKVRRVCYEML